MEVDGKRMEITLEEIQEWAEQVEGFLASRFSPSHLAPDLAQEAVERFWKKVQSGESFHRPRAYLFRIAHNLAVDEVRRQPIALLGNEIHEFLPDPASLPVEESCLWAKQRWVPKDDLLAKLPGALRRLPLRDQCILQAHYQGGMPCAQLAEEQGITLDNTKIRLFRARRRLRDILEAELEDCKA